MTASPAHTALVLALFFGVAASACIGSDENTQTASTGLAAATSAAQAWSTGAALVGIFGVQSNGVSNVHVTPPWSDSGAEFNLSTSRAGTIWTYAFADPDQPGLVLVSMVEAGGQVVSRQIVSDAQLAPLGPWGIDSDEAAACAASMDAAFHQPLDLDHEAEVYALYRPGADHPPTWFISRVGPASIEDGSQTFVARTHIVDALERQPVAQTAPSPR